MDKEEFERRIGEIEVKMKTTLEQVEKATEELEKRLKKMNEAKEQENKNGKH